MKTIKRITGVLLACLMFFQMFPYQANAEDTAEDPLGMKYGWIQVQDLSEFTPTSYRAAKDKNGMVYIHMEDFADIVGGYFSEYVIKDSYRYVFDFWAITIYTQENKVELGYDISYEAELEMGKMFSGEPIYKYFRLTELVYNEAEGAWYFPLEELMYLAHMQWMCEDGVVFVYRPETLLDVVAKAYQLEWNLPDYNDILGDTWQEQMGNSMGYGFMAAVDEMSLSFFADTFLCKLGIKGATGYEEDVLTEALLMLNIDTPQEGDYHPSYTDGFTVASEFVSVTNTTLEAALENTLIKRLYAMLGAPVTNEVKDAITSRTNIGTNIIKYAMDVGQVLWMRDYVTENFAQRLQYITDYSKANKTGDKENIYDLLAAVGDDTYKEYFGKISNVYLKEITLDEIFSLIDNIALAGGVDFAVNDLVVGPLRWANLMVSLGDLAIEATKLIPAIGEIMGKAEDIHLCLDLVRISTVMQNAYSENLEILLQPYWDIQKDELETLRVSLQAALCPAMHAHDKLIQMGNMMHSNYLPEYEFLQMINQSAKYDDLLILDRNLKIMYSEEAGCVKVQIPDSYVMQLPLINFYFELGNGETEVTTSDNGGVLPAGQALHLCGVIDRWHNIESVTLRHETYGEITHDPCFGGYRGTLIGIDLGDGQYTYVLELRCMGSIGGSEILIIRPINGQLKVVEFFNTAEGSSDSIFVKGVFLDEATLSGTIYPTETPFVGTVSYPHKDRIGTEIWGGLGYISYQWNEGGWYDLIYQTSERNLYNMDRIGNSSTRYSLKDGELTIVEQWYEMAP